MIMKKELLSFKNLIKLILIILFLLSISFIVQYNVKEYNKLNKNDSNVYKESLLFLKDLNASEVVDVDEFKDEIKVISDIKNKLNEDMFTIDSPLIINNPYGNNPLSAYIAFKTKEEKSINVVINGEYIYSSKVTNEHILPVFYLYANDTNIISLNGIEIPLVITYDEKTIDNNTNDLLYVYNESLDAYKNSKLVMSLNIQVDDYKILSNGSFLVKNKNSIYIITPYGLISDIYYFNDDIIDFNAYNDYLYILTSNGLLKLNKSTKEEIYFSDIKGTKIDINNNMLLVNNLNSIYFYNTGGELQFIFGETKILEYKDYYLSKNYYTKYLTNIIDMKYKDNYLYVLESNNLLRIYIINESNKSIRIYKTINNIDSTSISYEDKLILNNYEINDLKKVNKLNIESKKSYVKYPNIDINESMNIYYQTSNQKYNTLSDSEVASFKDCDVLSLNIAKQNNILFIDSDYKDMSIILLNEKGSIYEYKLDGKLVDLSLINDGKYFIYTKVDSKVYNVNRYIVKRS